MNLLEQLLTGARSDAELDAHMQENERRMVAAGFSHQDFAMFKAIYGWLPDISETAGFLSIMCRDFDHLQSAQLIKHLVPYMIQSAEFLHIRMNKARLDTNVFSLQTLDHTKRVLGKLLEDADRVIAKYELARSVAH